MLTLLIVVLRLLSCFLFLCAPSGTEGLAFVTKEPVGSAHWNAEAWLSEIQAESGTPTCAHN